MTGQHNATTHGQPEPHREKRSRDTCHGDCEQEDANADGYFVHAEKWSHTLQLPFPNERWAYMGEQVAPEWTEHKNARTWRAFSMRCFALSALYHELLTPSMICCMQGERVPSVSQIGKVQECGHRTESYRTPQFASRIQHFN